MTLAKICGVTNVRDAEAIARLGAPFVGLNFAAHSPRCISTDTAREIAAAMRPAASLGPEPTKLVGVFVDASLELIRELFRAGAIDIAQLHGSETIAFAAQAAELGIPLWKASTLNELTPEALAAWQRVGVRALVLDAAAARGTVGGGTGQTIDWAAAAGVVSASPIPIVLAGGLTPANVAAAIAIASPWCVDVASGVEQAPGAKDLAKVADFLRQARGVAA